MSLQNSLVFKIVTREKSADGVMNVINRHKIETKYFNLFINKMKLRSGTEYTFNSQPKK